MESDVSEDNRQAGVECGDLLSIKFMILLLCAFYSYGIEIVEKSWKVGKCCLVRILEELMWRPAHLSFYYHCLASFLQQATELKWRNAAWEGGKVLFSEDEALVGIKSLTVTDPVHEVSIWSLTQKNSSQLTKELFWLWRLLRPLLLSQLGQDTP